MDRTWSPQLLARSTGALLLISMVFGAFGEMYVPDTLLVASNAGATANNILQHQTLFRIGFVSYTIEGLCDATLTALLYLLLRPAGRELALIALLLRIVSTAAFAASEFFYFGAFSILRGTYLTAIPHDQINALALLFFRLYGSSGSVPTLFYGVALILVGRLVFVSGYLPRWLGALLAFGGFSTTVEMLLLFAAPAHSTDYLLSPMMVGMLALALWLLFAGVNVPNWQKRVAGVQPQLAGA